MWLDERLLGESASHTPTRRSTSSLVRRRVWVSSPQGEITLMMHTVHFIGYSIFLEIFLEMLFSVAFGVPEKSVFTRLFDLFATDALANFQGASITFRILLKYYTTNRSKSQYKLRKINIFFCKRLEFWNLVWYNIYKIYHGVNCAL